MVLLLEAIRYSCQVLFHAMASSLCVPEREAGTSPVILRSSRREDRFWGAVTRKSLKSLLLHKL